MADHDVNMTGEPSVGQPFLERPGARPGPPFRPGRGERACHGIGFRPGQHFAINGAPVLPLGLRRLLAYMAAMRDADEQG